MVEIRANLHSAGWRDWQDSNILPQTNPPQDIDSLQALAPQLADHKADFTMPVDPRHSRIEENVFSKSYCSNSLQIAVPDLVLFSQLLKHS